MASLDELKEALLQTLAAKGSLGQMKARIRSEIFSALDQNDEAGGPSSKAPLSNTNLLLNELIREYMAFNQYRYSLSVFLPETNQPEVPPFDRNFIAKELHVQENAHSVQIPLLYSIVAMLQQGRAGEPAPSASGVSLDDPSSSHQTYAAAAAGAPPAFQSQASVGSSTASYQPGQPSRAHAQSRQPNFGQDDAPKPMQFTNRF